MHQEWDRGRGQIYIDEEKEKGSWPQRVGEVSVCIIFFDYKLDEYFEVVIHFENGYCVLTAKNEH